MNMKKRWKAGILLLLVLMTVVWWNRKLLEINPFSRVTNYEKHGLLKDMA